MDLMLWAVVGSLAALGGWAVYVWVKKRGEAVLNAAKGKKGE